MAVITIRNIDESVITRLNVQAAQHGRSPEEEARQLILHGLSGAAAQPGLGSRIAQRVAGLGVWCCRWARSRRCARRPTSATSARRRRPRAKLALPSPSQALLPRAANVEHSSALATRNTRDFIAIEGLVTIDPWR